MRSKPRIQQPFLFTDDADGPWIPAYFREVEEVEEIAHHSSHQREGQLLSASRLDSLGSPTFHAHASTWEEGGSSN
jgi:hypothetical protein